MNTLSTTEAPAERELARILGVPDVAGEFDLDVLTPEQCAELAYDLGRRRAQALELVDAVLAPVNAVAQQAKTRAQAALIERGGKKLTLSTFDAVLKVATRKVKIMHKLLELHRVLPKDVCAALFSRKVSIKAHIDDSLLEKLATVIPEHLLDISVDANGTELNKIARDAGPTSPAGKIIAEGYVEEQDGAPYIVFEPRKSALKAVG